MGTGGAKQRLEAETSCTCRSTVFLHTHTLSHLTPRLTMKMQLHTSINTLQYSTRGHPDKYDEQMGHGMVVFLVSCAGWASG
jgi:hypothetical protein